MSDKMKKNMAFDDNVNENIIEYFEEKLNNMNKKKSELDPYFKRMIKTDEITQDDHGMIGLFFLEYTSIIMDLYLLGRMFKQFSKKDYPEEIYQEFTKNNIVLAGAEHIETYKSVLTKLGFSTLYEKKATGYPYTNPDARCVVTDVDFLKNYELPKCLSG